MDCKRATDLMMKYFDRTIGDLEEKEMILHMKGCNCCSLDFQWMKEAICSIETLEVLEAPEDFEAFVMEKIPINYYKSPAPKSNFFSYMAFAIAITAVFFSGAVYLYYGTVDLKEVHHLMRFAFKLMDIQGAFQSLLTLISKNIVKILIFGLRWLNSMGNVLINTRMWMYLLTLGSLCCIFVGIQHWLVRLTYEVGYRGGKIYEE